MSTNKNNNNNNFLSFPQKACGKDTLWCGMGTYDRPQFHFSQTIIAAKGTWLDVLHSRVEFIGPSIGYDWSLQLKKDMYERLIPYLTILNLLRKTQSSKS